MYEVQKLQDKHRRLLQLVAMGYSDVEIASTMGCSSLHVAQVRKSPVARGVLDKMHESADDYAADVQQQMADFAPRAAKMLKGAITGREEDLDGETSLTLSDRERAKLLVTALGIAGHGPVRRVDTQHSGGIVTANMLMEMKSPTIAEELSSSMMVEEAEYSEEKSD